MVAILLPQPDEPARGPDPATGRPVPSRRRATNPSPRPVDLATVEAIPLRSVPRALPDRPTRIRRRRLVALLVAVALFAAAATAGRALLGAAASVEPSSPQPVDSPASSPPGETYVVRPGDTLWSIAAAIAPDSDPRPVVDALRDANGGRPELQVGERLVVRLD
jgi:nucleoid-associated protein YgaU